MRELKPSPNQNGTTSPEAPPHAGDGLQQMKREQWRRPTIAVLTIQGTIYSTNVMEDGGGYMS